MLRPLLHNLQRSQETDIHAHAGFEPAIAASEQATTLYLYMTVKNKEHLTDKCSRLAREVYCLISSY